MAKLRKKNFANPDMLRDVGRGQLQIIELGDVMASLGESG